MALVRGQAYYFLTEAEFTALSNLSNNPGEDIFDTVFAAFNGNTVVINGETYYYAPVSSFPSLTDDDLDELYGGNITLDYQLFLSMATLHLSQT